MAMTSDILRRSVSSLPIQLGTRLVLDSISYTNPLPPWLEAVAVDYEARENAINHKIKKYLAGDVPRRPYEIEIPKKNGERKPWKVPSVNDQIIAQVCVSALAERIWRTVDEAVVLSYHYNTDPNRLQLTASQVSSWKQFQNETERRCRTSSDCLLQIDLKDAFESIDRVKFFDFLQDLALKSVEVALLKLMLTSFSGSNSGLPLVNDSIFFIGNAYLQVVDQLVRKHSTNFIRFVDDYHIFSDSRDYLEKLLEQVSQELASIGFKINTRKVKLGSAEDYLEALAQGKYAKTKEVDGSGISAAAFDDVIAPDVLANIVRNALADPTYLL